MEENSQKLSAVIIFGSSDPQESCAIARQLREIYKPLCTGIVLVQLGAEKH